MRITGCIGGERGGERQKDRGLEEAEVEKNCENDDFYNQTRQGKCHCIPNVVDFT